MTGERCDCDRLEVDEQRRPTAESAPDRWIAEPTDDVVLPSDVRVASERVLGADGVETLGDLLDALARAVGIDRDALCTVDGPTPHRGVLDGQTHHFACVFDAILLAELADAPVDVRTETPAGAVVEARATGDGDVAVVPDEAALSVGLRTDRDASPGDGPPLQAGYAAGCPAVRAFRNRAAYEAWASTAPAATIGLPLAESGRLAARIVA